MRSKIGYGVLGVAIAFLLATNPAIVNAAGQITSAQIKNNSIKSKDIKDNQIKGADVKESTLAKVPDADKVDGLDSQAFVQKSTVRAEQATCSGSTFTPIQDTDTWDTIGSLRFSTNSALVRCNVDLPAASIVRSVNFTVADSSAENVNCAMWKTSLTTGAETQMATVGTSGTPGNTVVTDTTILSATIDASNAYFLQCTLGTTSSVGLYASNVVFDSNAAGSALAGRPGPEARPGNRTP